MAKLVTAERRFLIDHRPNLNILPVWIANHFARRTDRQGPRLEHAHRCCAVAPVRDVPHELRGSALSSKDRYATAASSALSRSAIASAISARNSSATTKSLRAMAWRRSSRSSRNQSSVSCTRALPSGVSICNPLCTLNQGRLLQGRLLRRRVACPDSRLNPSQHCNLPNRTYREASDTALSQYLAARFLLNAIHEATPSSTIWPGPRAPCARAAQAARGYIWLVCGGGDSSTSTMPKLNLRGALGPTGSPWGRSGKLSVRGLGDRELNPLNHRYPH